MEQKTTVRGTRTVNIRIIAAIACIVLIPLCGFIAYLLFVPPITVPPEAGAVELTEKEVEGLKQAYIDYKVEKGDESYQTKPLSELEVVCLGKFGGKYALIIKDATLEYPEKVGRQTVNSMHFWHRDEARIWVYFMGKFDILLNSFWDDIITEEELNTVYLNHRAAYPENYAHEAIEVDYENLPRVEINYTPGPVTLDSETEEKIIDSYIERLGVWEYGTDTSEYKKKARVVCFAELEGCYVCMVWGIYTPELGEFSQSYRIRESPFDTETVTYTQPTNEYIKVYLKESGRCSSLGSMSTVDKKAFKNDVIPICDEYFSQQDIPDNPYTYYIPKTLTDSEKRSIWNIIYHGVVEYNEIHFEREGYIGTFNGCAVFHFSPQIPSETTIMGGYIVAINNYVVVTDKERMNLKEAYERGLLDDGIVALIVNDDNK